MKMKVCRLRKVIFLLAVWLDVSDALPKHRSLRGGRGQNSFQNPSNNHQRNLKPTTKSSKSSETTSSKKSSKAASKTANCETCPGLNLSYDGMESQVVVPGFPAQRFGQPYGDLVFTLSISFELM